MSDLLRRDVPGSTGPSTRRKRWPIFDITLTGFSRSAYIALEMNGSRILVVEDDGRLAATLDRVLTAEGHHIEVVGDMPGLACR